MKKTISLTESDLRRLIRQAINEVAQFNDAGQKTAYGVLTTVSNAIKQLYSIKDAEGKNPQDVANFAKALTDAYNDFRNTPYITGEAPVGPQANGSTVIGGNQSFAPQR